MVAPAYKLRELTSRDLPGVATVHLRAFPGSALTSLGHEVVQRYYNWQLAGPHEVVAIGITDSEGLTAFCFAGVFHGSLTGFLMKNWPYLLTRIALHPWILADSNIRAKVSVALRSLGSRRRRASARSTASGKGKPFGILSIAVDPTKSRMGQGKCLMNRAEQIAREREFSLMRLRVSPNNLQAIGFYERLGWTRKEAQSGAWSGTMQKDLGLRYAEF